MVFLQSELETVALFCGLLKSTSLCVNINLGFQRQEQLHQESESVLLKTGAGLAVRGNRRLWLARLIFGEGQKDERKVYLLLRRGI